MDQAAWYIEWANDEGVSKLLGAPFGISLSTKDVDKFLHEKLTKKLIHWSTTKIKPTRRNIIANSVLLSSTFFFLSIWSGSKQGIKRIKSSIMNYLAPGRLQRTKTQVGWLQCCQDKKEGILNLINLEDTIPTLMGKWLTKA